MFRGIEKNSTKTNITKFGEKVKIEYYDKNVTLTVTELNGVSHTVKFNTDNAMHYWVAEMHTNNGIAYSIGYDTENECIEVSYIDARIDEVPGNGPRDKRVLCNEFVINSKNPNAEDPDTGLRIVYNDSSCSYTISVVNDNITYGLIIPQDIYSIYTCLGYYDLRLDTVWGGRKKITLYEAEEQLDDVEYEESLQRSENYFISAEVGHHKMAISTNCSNEAIYNAYNNEDVINAFRKYIEENFDGINITA